MKLRATIILFSILALPAAGTIGANPPAPILGQFPPPAEPVQMDGPYRLHLLAQLRAERRLAQGYYALPLEQGGQWWVAYYPWCREPRRSHNSWNVGCSCVPAPALPGATEAPTVIGVATQQ